MMTNLGRLYSHQSQTETQTGTGFRPGAASGPQKGSERRASVGGTDRRGAEGGSGGVLWLFRCVLNRTAGPREPRAPLSAGQAALRDGGKSHLANLALFQTMWVIT